MLWTLPLYLIKFFGWFNFVTHFLKLLFLEPFRHHYEKTKPFMKEKLLLNGFMGKFILLLHFIIISILFDLSGF